MSLQTQFVALVASIFEGRVYPQTAPKAPPTPYCTYFRASSVEQPTLDDNGGTGNDSNTRLQIDVWASTYDAAQEKTGEVKAALKSWDVQNVVLSERDMHEPDTMLHRVLLDVSTWHA